MECYERVSRLTLRRLLKVGISLLLLQGILCAQANSTNKSATPQHVIAPNDMLNISVLKRPELSGTVKVDTDGNVVLGKLGLVRASGMTTDHLESELQKRLASLIQNPQVTVLMANAGSPESAIARSLASPAASSTAEVKQVSAAQAAQSNSSQPVGRPTAPSPSAQQAVAESTSDLGADYVIGPEDVINISVWKEPDFSGQVPVRPDGKISLALLGDIQAAGMTPMTLSKQLRDSLSKYVEDPRVTVIVSTINSRRVYIMGQVGRPGAFPLQPQMTVLQALSTAGGTTQFANTKNIYILRKSPTGPPVRLPFNYKDVIRGLKPEQDIQLQVGDTIVVP